MEKRKLKLGKHFGKLKKGRGELFLSYFRRLRMTAAAATAMTAILAAVMMCTSGALGKISPVCL